MSAVRNRRNNRSPEARRRRNARRNGMTSNPSAPPITRCSCIPGYSGPELRCPRCRGLSPYVPCPACRYEPDGQMAASGLTATPWGGAGASASRGGERSKSPNEAELSKCLTCRGKGRVLLPDDERNAA